MLTFKNVGKKTQKKFFESSKMAQIIPVQKYTCLYLPVGTQLRSIGNVELSSECLGTPTTWSPPNQRTGTCNLSKLLRDMSFYHLASSHQNAGHSGDLLDHSLWTYYLLAAETAIPKMFQPWFLQNITEEYYPVLQVAGLVHDIGKSGDLDLEYTQKPNHPLQSWLYFQNIAEYIWVDGNKVPLLQYLSENCALTNQEWILVGIIAALHYDLGDFLEKKLTMGQLINRLTSHLKNTGISFDPVMVFRLIRAVTLADVWAQRPVKPVNGYIQIDRDIVASQRRPFVENNWNKYFNEERFSLTRQIEEQISGLRFSACVGPINFYIYDQEGGNVITSRAINLIVLIPDNIQLLLTDSKSPYSHSVELDTAIYKLITNKTHLELRKYFIRELITEIEICSFPFAKEARSEIYQWYFSAGENKLSRNEIQNLIKRLEGYPRNYWSSDRIDMTIRRLVSPNYNIEQFINDYDKIYYEHRIKHLETEIKTLMTNLGSLGFKDVGKAFGSWDELIELMIKDDSFQTPLLSPKGLLILRNILHGLSCRQYQNPILDSLLNHMTASPTGLFGEKYGIYGLYVNDSNRVNVLSPYKVTSFI